MAFIFSPALFRMLPAGAQKNRQDVCEHAVTRHSFSKSPKTCPPLSWVFKAFCAVSRNHGRQIRHGHSHRALPFVSRPKGGPPATSTNFSSKRSVPLRETQKGGCGTTTLLHLLYKTKTNFIFKSMVQKKTKKTKPIRKWSIQKRKGRKHHEEEAPTLNKREEEKQHHPKEEGGEGRPAPTQ